MRRTGLELKERREADRVSVLLVGELDIDSAHRLQQAIARLFAAGRVEALTLDLSGLAFIDSTGLAAIVYASKLCERSGCELAVIRGPGYRAAGLRADRTARAASVLRRRGGRGAGLSSSTVYSPRVRTLIVGHGGRESALASRMAEHSELYAFAGHLNPSLVRYAESSGGKVQIGDVCDARGRRRVRARARDRHRDGQRRRTARGRRRRRAARAGHRAPSAPRATAPRSSGTRPSPASCSARSRPRRRPSCASCTAPTRSTTAIASFGSLPVVVKPSGLTGGKGVKVMGPHLASHAEAADYARSLLAGAKPGDSVLIEEKIVGAEFTIQAISDGHTVVLPAFDLRLPLPLRRRRGPRHGRHGLAQHRAGRSCRS